MGWGGGCQDGEDLSHTEPNYNDNNAMHAYIMHYMSYHTFFIPDSIVHISSTLKKFKSYFRNNYIQKELAIIFL